MKKKLLIYLRVLLLVVSGTAVISLPFIWRKKTPEINSQAQEEVQTNNPPDIELDTDQPLTNKSTQSTFRYIAGLGIDITGNTISNTDLGSAQYIFKNIVVEDQDTLTAVENNDSLKISAGSGISLTTNSDKTELVISNTITSSDLNGWNSSSGLLKLSDVDHDVAIGGSSSLGKLSVWGDDDEKLLVIRANASQTNNLLDLQNESGTTLAAFDKDGDLVFGNEKTLSLTANKPSSGSISRLITLNATSQYDRPWISSIDYTGRHVAAFGTHGVNYSDGSTHNRWEVKTSTDPAGGTPDAMLTRFAIDYNSDLANVIFSDIDTIGIHNNYGDRIEYVAQMRDAGDTGSYAIGQWITELGAGDSTLMSFDTLTLASDADATLRFFRETNTTGQRRLVVMKGDGTATETFTINADTGRLRVHTDGEVAFWGSDSNTAAYNNFQSNRTMVGYDGSFAVLQGGTSKGVKLNVGQSSFGQGTMLTITPAGLVGIGTSDPDAFFHVEQNGKAATFGDQTNTSSYIDFQSARGGVGYDGSSMVLQGGTSKGIKLNVNNSSFGTGTVATFETDGDVGFGVAPTLGPFQLANGAYVTTGGTWTNSSDRNLKENFLSVDTDLVLEKIIQLPMTEWNYKNEANTIRHIGPIAQDFYSIFGLGNNDTSISSIDPSGIALVGIQGLHNKIKTLETQINSATSSGQSSQNQIQTDTYEIDLDDLSTLTVSDSLETNQLSVLGQARLVSEAIFEGVVRFMSEVIFRAKVLFETAPVFPSNMGGRIVIHKGANQVSIPFSSPFENLPQVTVSLVVSNDESVGDMHYAVKDLSTLGFTLKLNKVAESQLEFSWIAVSVENAQTTHSESASAFDSNPKADEALEPSTFLEENTELEASSSASATTSAAPF